MDPQADSKLCSDIQRSPYPRCIVLVLAPLAAMSDQEPTTRKNGELAPLLGGRVSQDPTPLPRGPISGPLTKTAPPNPLPKGQMFALLLLMTAEPVMGLSILPYINEVCSSPV